MKFDNLNICDTCGCVWSQYSENMLHGDPEKRFWECPVCKLREDLEKAGILKKEAE